MRRALIAITGLVAAAGLGALAAGLASGDPAAKPLEIDPDRQFERLAVEPMAPGAATARSARVPRAKRAGAQMEYFQTVDPIEVASGTEEAATLTCPKGYKAAGGFFVTGRAGGAFLDLNAPKIAEAEASGDAAQASNRSWVIGVFNTSSEPDQVTLGVVCIRKP
jgi:hypothetical protein